MQVDVVYVIFFSALTPGRRKMALKMTIHMSALTGLTGKALVIYIIISEGSRLFPPRNAVPAP